MHVADAHKYSFDHTEMPMEDNILNANDYSGLRDWHGYNNMAYSGLKQKRDKKFPGLNAPPKWVILHRRLENWAQNRKGL